MKTIKYPTMLICIFCNIINVFPQEIDYNCNIDIDNCVFIDSLVQENNLINREKTKKYWCSSKSYLLITNTEDYNLFKTNNAKDIDFEQYNIFIGFFNSYGVCKAPSVLPVKFSLLFDERDSKNITSIVQTIHTPYLKLNCPSYFITVVIPKKYCDKICYTKKFIENES
jgi:hypothetical protein